MVDRLSWLALLAALSFSTSVVVMGSGGRASEAAAPACCASQS